MVDGQDLVGIITNRDVRFETQLDQPVRNLMTPKDRLVTVREGAPAEEVLALMHRHRIEKTRRDARVLNISGTDLRQRLSEGREIPEWFTFPKVAEELRRTVIRSALGSLSMGAVIGAGVIATARWWSASVLAQAAAKHDVHPRSISFKGAMQTLEAFQQLIAFFAFDDSQVVTDTWRRICVQTLAQRLAPGVHFLFGPFLIPLFQIVKICRHIFLPVAPGRNQTRAR